MTMKTTITIHTAAYERSHGRKPSTATRGTGGWAFQETSNPNCFDAHLIGEPIFVQAVSLRDAVNHLRARGLSGEFALLP